MRRLEKVTWDATKCELLWVISTGTSTGDQYTPSTEQTYRIDMDSAIMQVGGERRGFEMDEAKNVHLLMDLISRYATESTVWWERGEGERISDTTGPVARHRMTVPAAPRNSPNGKERLALTIRPLD
jgi:hypothetical protein